MQVFTNQGWEEKGSPIFECDANEQRYKDYSEKFPQCTNYCLPEGEWKLKLVGSEFSGLTLATTRCPGHNGMVIGWAGSSFKTRYQMVLIGERDDDEYETPEDWIDSYLENGMQKFGELNELVYRYALLEENKIVVDNSKIKTV